MEFRSYLGSVGGLPEADHRTELSTFIQSQLKDSRLSMSRGQKIGVGRDAFARFHEVEMFLVPLLGIELQEGGAQAQQLADAAAVAVNDPQGATTEVIHQLAGVAGLVGEESVVESAINAIFGVIPGLNVLYGLGKTSKDVAKLVKDGSGLLAHRAARKTAMSEVYSSTLVGITTYQQRDVYRDVGRIGEGVAYTGVSAATGVGGVAVTAGALVARTMTKIAELVLDYQRAQQFNGRTETNLQAVENAIIPTLYLPHLDIDAMALLGIAPVGWRGSPAYSELQNYVGTNYPWLLHNLTWDQGQGRYVSRAFVNRANPGRSAAWERDFNYLSHILGEADVWMAVPPWTLLSTATGQAVHEPKYAPKSTWRKIAEQANDLKRQALQKAQMHRIPAASLPMQQAQSPGLRQQASDAARRAVRRLPGVGGHRR